MSLDNLTYHAVTSGRKTVASAGTAEQITTTLTPIRRVDITAETDNTGKIALGGSTAVATEGSQQGVILEPGQTYTFHITDLSKIYVNATVNGDGVTYNYLI